MGVKQRVLLSLMFAVLSSFGCADEPTPVALAQVAEIRKPTSAEVFAALVAVEFYAATRDAERRLPVQDVKDAVEVLARDRDFGWDARLSYARARLGIEAVSVMGTDLEKTAAEILTSTACCAKLTGCELAKATPLGMKGAVWFQLEVPRPYSKLAEILDPQSWSDISGSWFLRSERQELSACPATKPPDVNVPPILLGKSWCDTIYESFEYQPSTQQGLKFENSLFFKTVLDPLDPQNNPIRRYDLRYGICPNGSYAGRWRGNQEAQGQILRDSGCSSAADLNTSDDGLAEKSVVEGVKRLHLGQDLCNNGACDVDDARFLDSVMRALAIVTRISVCLEHHTPGSCDWLVPCGTDNTIDSGMFGCGFAVPADFTCN